MYREISQCRICGNSNLVTVLDLGTQALTGVFPKSGQVVETGPLELVKCVEDAAGECCGLVQLRHSFEPEQMYGENYGYRSGLNQSMVLHLQQKATAIKQIAPLQAGDLALDIGSNDGTLLRAIAEPGVELIGMDPSGVGFAQYYPPGARLIPDFFSAARFKKELGERRARIVTSIAMFYDLDEPLRFMQDVYEVLADDGIWVFEQSYLPRMLEMNSYDTVCHEHVEYYALKQILWMVQRAGFKVLNVEFNDVNGGSFSIVAAKSTSKYQPNETLIARIMARELNDGIGEFTVYREFSERTFRHRDALRSQLATMKKSGQRVLGYGASTKGNVVLQFCGITSELLPAIAEVNASKFGHFTPGTLIPIISEAEAHASKPYAFMVLPWHFRDGIIRKESSFLNSGGRLLFPLPEIELVGNSHKDTETCPLP